MPAKFPKSWSPRVGDIVEVRFHDHSEESHDPQEGAIHFCVFGRLHKITKSVYIVHSWAYVAPDGYEEGADSNIVGFTIVRKAITEIRRLTHAR